MNAFKFKHIMSRDAFPSHQEWKSLKDYEYELENYLVERDWFYYFLPMALCKWPGMFLLFEGGFRSIMVPALTAVRKFGIHTIVFINVSHVGSVNPLVPLPVMDIDEITYLNRHGVEIGVLGYDNSNLDSSNSEWNHSKFSLIRDFFFRFNLKEPKSFLINENHMSFGLIDSVTKAQYEEIFVYGKHSDSLVKGYSTACMDYYIDGDGEKNNWPW